MNLEPSKTGFIRIDAIFECIDNAFEIPFVWFTSDSVKNKQFSMNNFVF